MLNATFAIVHAMGCSKVRVLNCSKAIIPSACRKAVASQVNRDSSNGSFQDFLIVGPKPETPVATKRMID